MVHGTSGLYLVVYVPAPLAVGSVASLEWNDTLLLGEVDYCRANGSKFLIGLNVPRCQVLGLRPDGPN